MPGSAQEGKDLVKEFCIRNNVKTVLDIGPGEGTYYYTLKDIGLTQLDGIEVWAPYVNQFALTEKYNQIFIGDAYYFNWDKLPVYDMVLLGDVFEHMYEDQGKEVLAKAVEHGKYVTLSLPIYGYPQGVSFDGNWFEAHLEQYNHDRITELLSDYDVFDWMNGEILGAYIFAKKGTFAA